jgi:hypothetical protein
VGEPDFVANTGALGSSGKVKLVFKAESDGSQSLLLVYHRAWEKDVPPTNSFDVNVFVGEKGIPTLQPAPTMIPQPIPTTVVFPPTGMKGWKTYTNTTYGFSFQYPPEWTIQEGKGTMIGHALLLTPNTTSNAQLQIAFKLASDTAQIGRTGVGSGEMVVLGKVDFMGKEIDRLVLVSENKQMTVMYTCTGCMQRGNVIYGFDLDYLGNWSDPTGLPENIRAMADLIVASVKTVTP